MTRTTLATLLTAGALLAASRPAQAQAPKAPWDCTTRTLLDYLPSGEYLHEVGVVSLASGSVAEAQDAARRRARRGLEERICGHAECPEVRAAIGTTEVGKGGDHVCALALVDASTVRQWSTLDMEPFVRDLDAALEGLLKGRVGASPVCTADGRCSLLPVAAERKPLRVALAVGEVMDGGMPGGERADWLRDQLLARMTRWEGAVQLRHAPSSWEGSEPPPGADVLLSAKLVTFAGGQAPVAHVTCVATFREKRGPSQVRVAQPIQVLESRLPAPAPTTQFPTLASTPGLALRTDARGGSICPGQYVQLGLRSDRKRFVRVFNLFGAGKDRRATLIFPNSQVPASQRRGEVRSGDTVLGADAGFQAYPLGGDGEGFLVLAADTEAGLGEFAAMRSECRVGRRLAQRLWAPERLSKALARDLGGYRIVSRESCPQSFEEPPTPEATEAALAQLPECPEPGVPVATPAAP